MFAVWDVLILDFSFMKLDVVRHPGWRRVALPWNNGSPKMNTIYGVCRGGCMMLYCMTPKVRVQGERLGRTHSRRSWHGLCEGVIQEARVRVILGPRGLM